MDPQFEELARKVATEVIEQLSVKLAGVEFRFEEQLQVQSESIKHVLNHAAEGHATTVESIHQTLDRLEKLVDRLGEHDSILNQHNQRISTLEKNRIS
jgi:ABC-type transporter Mla subunit MlaD